MYFIVLKIQMKKQNNAILYLCNQNGMTQKNAL